MDESTRVYGDEHVEVFRHGGNGSDPDELDSPFYRIRAGDLEFTYDPGARAWYVYMPGRERLQTPVSTHPYYLSEQGFTMVNIDWDHTQEHVYGIEIVGGNPDVDLVIYDVGEPAREPKPGQGPARGRGRHLQLIRPVEK